MSDETVSNNIALTQAFIVQLCSAGMAISTAIAEGYQYLCELLRSQGNRNPAARMALAASMLEQIARGAGVHPDQQRQYIRTLMRESGEIKKAERPPYMQLYKRESEERGEEEND